jgi:hypothetical protein
MLRTHCLSCPQGGPRSASRVEYPRVLINDHAEEVFQDRLGFLVYVNRFPVCWSII